MRIFLKVFITFALFMSIMPHAFADIEVVDDLAPTTIKFDKEVYKPGETIELTAETDNKGSYIPNSIRVEVDFEKVPSRNTRKTEDKLYKVKAKFKAPDVGGTFFVSYKISMKDKDGKIWNGYAGQRIAVHDPQLISLSPSKATIKVGEELYLVGKHLYKNEKDVKTQMGIFYGDTGYGSLKNIEKGDSRELAVFEAGKPGKYIITFSVSFKKDDGTEHYEYLNSTVTVELP
ncbi:hypothetical protein [Brevibacillus sp. SYSU BS000544]|uniref:hypothetical protein n=1 Tax=Brevibacillus sp. SYSU BS000544 TaxID=3416443 RepID=UPI003CE48E6E